VPHRLRYFQAALRHICSRGDVLIWTGEQILDWYLDLGGGSADKDSPAASARGGA
jgi:hypothetical protein